MMNKINISFYLSIWASIMATISFLFSLLKFRKEIKGKVEAKFNILPDFSNIEVILMNTSFRPLTILSYEVLYAANEFYFQVVTHVDENQPSKIQESETQTLNITRATIVDRIKLGNIEQRYYHSLKLKIITTNSGNFLFDIDIPLSIINHTFYEPAGRFIAADLFLGFEQRESNYYTTGRNISGGHK